MRPFHCEHGVVVPLDRSDVDTDQIIPKQFLKRIERAGYGEFLFNDWRYDETGAERPDFVLNRPEYRTGSLLVAGRNFACGSSREHAVWALADQGFRAVIAPSFADIFRNNAVKCGLLPVVLPEAQVRQILDVATEEPGVVGIVDLEEQTVAVGDLRFRFETDPFERPCLLDGLDEIGLSLIHEPAISAFEARRPAWMPSLSGPVGAA